MNTRRGILSLLFLAALLVLIPGEGVAAEQGDVNVQTIRVNGEVYSQTVIPLDGVTARTNFYDPTMGSSHRDGCVTVSATNTKKNILHLTTAWKFKTKLRWCFNRRKELVKLMYQTWGQSTDSAHEFRGITDRTPTGYYRWTDHRHSGYTYTRAAHIKNCFIYCGGSDDPYNRIWGHSNGTFGVRMTS